MSFKIPKIQWGNTTITGTTALGSNAITAIADTSGLTLGMTLDDPEFPAGTIITVINSFDIEVSENATGATAASRSFHFEFIFRFPSITDDGEKQKPKRRVKTSISGIDQVSIDHIRFERELEWGHLTETETNTLKNDFYKAHAIYGRSFLYFEDKDLPASFTYELADGDFEPERLGNSDKFGFSTTFKRVEL